MKNTITCDRKGLHDDLEIFQARCLGRFLVFLQHQCNLSHVVSVELAGRGISVETRVGERGASWQGGKLAFYC
jgi:hypothetical protein